MIAPFRSNPDPITRAAGEPRPIGDILPEVLARYGITRPAPKQVSRPVERRPSKRSSRGRRAASAA
jgi:hypothetical protein